MPKGRTQNNILRNVKLLSSAGSKYGPSDWYPEVEKAIVEALAKGDDFTTGWYASKKESASARITKQGDHLTIEVFVTDDDDLEGRGDYGIEFTTDLDRIRYAIDEAWQEAKYSLEDHRRDQEDEEAEEARRTGTDCGSTRKKYLTSIPASERICFSVPGATN